MNPNSRERGLTFEAKGMLSEGLVHVAGPEQVRSDEMRLEGKPASQDQRQGLGNAARTGGRDCKVQGKEFGHRKGEELGPIIQFTSEDHHYHILLRIKKKKRSRFLIVLKITTDLIK